MSLLSEFPSSSEALGNALGDLVANEAGQAAARARQDCMTACSTYQSMESM
ncbi:MAG: hypothetical protein IT382_09260 [Deltaproteobacteria bacterium]|nr:hypothetical protein [Deltaproteobacteria bacterium]